MPVSLVLCALALASLLPPALLSLRGQGRESASFRAALAVAVLVPALWAGSLLAGEWQTGLAAALAVTIAACTAVFAVLCLGTLHAWRLAPLLMPYLALLGLLGSAASGGNTRPLVGGAPAVWLDLHILVSVLTYALLTLAAVAALGAFLQEGALKRKRPTSLTRLLPSVADGEALSGRLLAASEAVLGLGLVTGMATQFFETGAVLRLDHKILLSLVAFVLIGLLLAGRRVCGIRGRLAARLVLGAYLLLTLAYPGVKFVSQVLL